MCDLSTEVYMLSLIFWWADVEQSPKTSFACVLLLSPNLEFISLFLQILLVLYVLGKI